MTHFYKHIEEIPKQINPTGLKSYPYMRIADKTLFLCELIFYKSLFSTTRELWTIVA